MNNQRDIQLHKEIKDYKESIFFGLSMRQSFFSAIAAIVAVIAGLVFNISSVEWFFVILIIGLVAAAEMINTAIERCVDLVTKEYKELAKNAKDIAAGAVLVMSMFSVVIGIIIFLPKIMNLLGGI